MTKPPLSRRAARDAGYTLLEALVVLTIVSLASAIIFSRAQSGAGRLSLAGEARELTAVLREAQTGALRLNRDVAVTFSADATQYASDLSDAPHRLSAGRLAVTASVHRTQAEDSVVTFHRDGRASGADIMLHDAQRGYVIRIDPATGAVSVESMHAPAPD